MAVDSNSKIRFYNTDGTAEFATAVGAGIISSANQEVLISPKTTITSANVLNLFSSPVSILSPAGVGKAYLPLFLLWQIDFQSVQYATNTSAYLYYTSNSADELILFDIAVSNNNIIRKELEVDFPVKENDSISIAVDSGNPTAGDSDLNVWLGYTIIDLS